MEELQVVLNVNPYKQLKIYGQDVSTQYENRDIHTRPPHIFALADAVHKTMRRLNKDTCIVISGNCLAYRMTGRRLAL